VAGASAHAIVIDIAITIGEKVITNFLHEITQVPIDFPIAAALSERRATNCVNDAEKRLAHQGSTGNCKRLREPRLREAVPTAVPKRLRE